MTSTITYGMPYTTMQYSSLGGIFHEENELFPTIGSAMSLNGPLTVDGRKHVKCGPHRLFHVDRDLEFTCRHSDFTWIVFVSEPVKMQCVERSNGATLLQIVEFAHNSDIDRNLVVRAALAKQCSTGKNAIYCHQVKMHPTALLLGQGQYDKILRDYADLFPGPDSSFDYIFNEEDKTATLIFDWDVQSMSRIALHPPTPKNETGRGAIAFALPHHFDGIVQLPPADNDIYCVASLVGPACLYEGSTWEIVEDIPEIGFRAARFPSPWSIPFLSESLKTDILFTLPDFYERGAGDTYFSGKMLARLARILLIAEEFNQICNPDHPYPDGYDEVCTSERPTQKNILSAIDRLKSSVEVWVNGTAEIPFVYDEAWGGVVSCGCNFDQKKGVCKNTFPECPGFEDPGLNFGVSCVVQIVSSWR